MYTNMCYLPLVHVAGSSGTVLLVSGLIPEEGTVQVCVNGVWSSVCDNSWDYRWDYSSWDYKDAFVVCRQLGYPATGENDEGPCTVSSVSVCWRVLVVSGPCQYETRLNEPLNVQASYYSAACLSKTLKV